MESRIISIEEANKMLPLLRQIVMDIIQHWDEIISKRTELECVEKELAQVAGKRESQPKRSSVAELKADLNYLIDKINSYIREVEQLGCFVEEFKRGIINFPSLFHGRKVFLCWKPDEVSVTHWHELDETFKDRVKIRDLAEFLYPRP